MLKKTKIIASIWPSTNTKEKIIDLYKSWVNILRFNFSHADYNSFKDTVELVKDLNKSWITNLSILLDTKWPEIRTWDIKNKISFEKWDNFKLYFWERPNDDISLYCDYPYLSELKLWDIIRIDSWLFDAKVINIYDKYLELEALNSANIWSRRHVNLPWVKIKLPWITEKDKQDILFWLDHWIDFIAMSFVRNKLNIDELKSLLYDNNSEHVKIISKIENQEAIDNIDEIIESSDWVMIARWDLGIEIDIEKLPSYQKAIVQKCREKWKVSIIATHLLETMIDSPFPIRAEVWDIHNSVLQKTDALMLSGETTIWKYPIKSVQMMSQVIKTTEENINYDHYCFDNVWLNQRDIEKKKLIKSALYIWEDLWVKAVILLTKKWKLARIAAAYRPNTKVYAFSMNDSTLNYINILFWIEWVKLDFDWTNIESVEKAINLLYKMWKLDISDKVISVADTYKNWKEIPVMQIINVEDILN